MQTRACTAEVRVPRHRQGSLADARGIDAMLDTVATAHDRDVLVTLPEHDGSMALPGGIAEIRGRRLPVPRLTWPRLWTWSPSSLSGMATTA